MKNRTVISFTGDLSFSGYFADEYKNPDVISGDILNYLNASDAVVINYESPITTCRMNKKTRLVHRSDPEVIDFIQEKFHNPILSFANNHMLDYKSLGMIDTLDECDKRNQPFIGAGRNRKETGIYQIIGDDVKVGVFSLEYKKLKRRHGSRYVGPLQEDMLIRIQEVIDELRPQVDYIVLVYHGGDEFLYAPMPYIRKLLKKFLGMGVDAIVAHHPHVVEGYEYVDEKLICYSLGNFLFDTDYQRAQEGTTEGMTVRLTFTKDGYTFDNMPTHIDRNTMTVGLGSHDPHFVDLKSINYSAAWCIEAYRKLQSLENAKELRLKDKEELEILKAEREEQMNALMEKLKADREELGLDIDDDEEETEAIEEIEEELPPVKTSGGVRKKIRKVIRKVRRKLGSDRRKTIRKQYLRFGRLKYRILYRNMKAF